MTCRQRLQAIRMNGDDPHSVAEPQATPSPTTCIADPLVRDGVAAAIERTLLPAMSHAAYPGHFTVTVDGRHFGSDTTWPGLDSWEMAGAYLLLGQRDLVRDYLAFVKAAQREEDDNIPFAIVQAKRLRLQGVTVGSRRDQLEMVRGIEASGIRPVIDRTYPLAETAAAFRQLDSGEFVGKICVSIPD